MQPQASTPGGRLTLIDALRGSALMGLFLLHCVEHFDFMKYPETSPAWLKALDSATVPAAFAIFGGKAYAVFALMFGLSFFIILDKASRRGEDYRGRFIWRLCILAVIGYVHGLVYCGDILLVLAVMGLPLALLYRAGNRLVAILAAVFLIQIPNLWEVWKVLGLHQNPPVPCHWNLYGGLEQVYAADSLWGTLRANLVTGQLARIFFTLETGRWVQMAGLFLCGLLIGRSRAFEQKDTAVRFGKRVFWAGFAGTLLFLACFSLVPKLGLTERQGYQVSTWLGAYIGLSETALWVGGFTLLYCLTRFRGLLDFLAPVGRMSLTNYLVQALVWVPFYYGYGLGMYRYIGPFWGFMLGIPFFVFQSLASSWWLARYEYGPAEWFWRSATKLSFSTPFRKRPAAPPASASA